jgi:hypothetical protein
MRPLVLVLALAAILAVPAVASAPPVGPLPAGPVQHITTQRNQLVAVALPRAAHGRVWRLARPVDPKILREVSEVDVPDGSVVVVFRSIGRGSGVLAYGLTRGETGHAFASQRFAIVVR